MQTKDNFIDSVLALNDVSYGKTARPAGYIEVFEGSIYEWQADTVNAVWNRIDCSILNLNFQQGQSKTVSAQVPIELFRNSGGQLEYNYDTGIYTSTTGLHLSKGYLIRAYTGYCENEAPYTEHVKLRFTGIIESILPNDDGIMEVNGVDFSIIFMNALNYNYPDINSYRDLPWTETTARVASNFAADVNTFNVLNADSSIRLGAKIKIGTEVMLVLNISNFDELKILVVQRLSGVTAHSQNDILYVGDEYLVMPDDVYNDSLLNKYVPAYDNWRLDYALRDLCIKAKFPLDLFNIAYNDEESIRLGRADKYPYMQSKSIFERIADANPVFAPKDDNTSQTTSDGTKGYKSVVEKKAYSGIDEEMLNEAKFKLEFGQSLWDAILTLTEGFGFKVFFNEQGVLTIKAIRQYIWLRPDNYNENSVELIENHVWSWFAWDIKSQTDKIYRFDLTVATIPTAASIRNLRVRFISNENDTDSATIQLKRYNSGAWSSVGSEITVPALKKYQYYEVEIYRATNADTAFIPDTYGVVMTNTPTSAPYFNGLLYLDNNDEVVSFECSSELNAMVSSAVNSSAEVRNQMTVIGLPESPQPIISRAVDTASIYGGRNIIKGGWTGTDSFVSSLHPFMDGRYDKYSLFKGTDGLGVRVYSLVANWNLICLYVKPQTTPLGTTIFVMDDVGQEVIVPEYTVSENDLTSGGIWLKMPKSYNKSMVRIYTSIDIYVSEIECYEYDPAYNFVGHKKETIVVKKNISDKATSDWISLTQLEMHRRNIKQFSISILSNPYIEIGDCCIVEAPEVGAFNDTRLWITGISTEVSRINSVDTLTLVALPPMQSYIKPPNPATKFLANKAYGFSITRKQVSSNTEIVTTPYVERSAIKLLTAASAVQTAIDVYCDEEFIISSGQLIQIDSEYMLVGTPTIAYDVGSGKWHGNLTVTRAKNYTIATAHAINAVVTANEVCSGFQPPDEYLTFNFALTRQQKVQIVVGVLHRKHTLAYVMEEKILDAGVYKRENGIRWDGGLNFAKVWPESVSKIYLGPNDSYNYMYNRMFHVGATTSWEDPKRNFYLWQFDQNIDSIASSNSWLRTPSQYDASLIIKPVLNGFLGNASIIQTEKKTIGLKTNCHVYKLKWGQPIPLYNSFLSFQPVSIPLQVKKDNGNFENINDAIYFDAYVATSDGSNINLMNTTATNPETARRWVSPIALNQIIQWDFTDSQGKAVKVAVAPGAKYRMHLLNIFDIYGEGVEVVKEGTSNLIDGSLTRKIDNTMSTYYTQPNALSFPNWEIKAQGYGAEDWHFSRPPQGPWNVLSQNQANPKYSSVQINVSGAGVPAGVGFTMYKYAKVLPPYWDDTAIGLSPVFMKYTPPSGIKKDTQLSNYYFRLFFKNVVACPYASVDQLWNPYVVITYRDNVDSTVRQKQFKLPLSDVTGIYTSASYIFTTNDFNDVDIITSIIIEFRCLGNSCPVPFLQSFSPDRNNPGIPSEYSVGISGVEFGTGNVILPDYQESNGDVRSSDIFYLTE